MEMMTDALLDLLAGYRDVGPPETEEEVQDRMDFEAHNAPFIRRYSMQKPEPQKALALRMSFQNFVAVTTAARDSFSKQSPLTSLRHATEGTVEPQRADDAICAPAISEAANIEDPCVPIVPAAEVETPDIESGRELPTGDSRAEGLDRVGPVEYFHPFETPTKEAPSARDLTTKPHALGMVSRRMSENLSKFLAYRKEQDGDERAVSDVAPIVKFAIELLGDPVMTEFSGDDLLRLKTEMVKIPTNDGFSVQERASLFTKYEIATACEYKRNKEDIVVSLERVSKSTINNRYKSGLRAFFSWCIDHKLAYGPVPDFSYVTKQNPGKSKRDSFRAEEVLRLASMPLFVGCKSIHNAWLAGDRFIQTFFYWCVLISMLCGLRPGEIAQLRCRDILDLYNRPHFRFAKFVEEEDDGDGSRPGGNQGKTPSAFRWVVIHNLLIRLGIVEQRDAIVAAFVRAEENRRGGAIPETEMPAVQRAAFDQWLFPDWKVYVDGRGRLLWSHAATKAWEHLKTYGFDRRGLSLYSARHFFKGKVDDLRDLSERSRRIICGWSTEDSVPNQYGPKQLPKSK